MDNQQLSTKKNPTVYKVGDVYGDLKILELYPNKSVCKVKCLKCGFIYDAAKSSISSRKNKSIFGCKKCWQQRPLKPDNYKYHPGNKIGDYELISCLGHQEGKWNAKCLKCGQEQIIRIPNAKKRISSGCSYCNPHNGQRMPTTTNPSIVYNKPIYYTLDERSYRSYKKKFEVFNKHKTRKQKEFDLTLEEWIKLIHSNCHYCGAEPSSDNQWNKGHNVRKTKPEVFYMNGIDRVDPNKGYTKENCVPCCSVCNRMKWDLNKDTWINHMQKILNHLSESSTTISKESTLQADGNGNGGHPKKDEDIV